VAGELRGLTGKDTRHVVLGHLLRWGSPTSFDRLIAVPFGAAAVRALAEAPESWSPSILPRMRYVPLGQAAQYGVRRGE
jgi:6-phosphofructokinase